MPELNNLVHLLQGTKRIIAHHDELSKAKGDHFNIFSVLKIENRENNTHSAFLAELLNPKGSHLQGSIFLKLFLQLISKELANSKVEKEEGGKREEIDNFVDKFINNRTTKVTTEFHIGNVNNEDKEGGRVDIFIKNGNNILCIENKIHAPDQYAQVQRYCNFKRKHNNVFYLTLKGTEPHGDSCGKLVSGKDFYNLSYLEHIIEWLELCLKEVPNLTSVREAINQYILLIKKLTKTLNMEQEKKIQDIMVKYIEEASFVATKYEDMVNKFKNRFRVDIKTELEIQLDPKIFKVVEGKPVSQKYSQLWIELRVKPEIEYKYGIESFNGRGHGSGNMFVGLLDKEKSSLLRKIEESGKLNDMWRHTAPINTIKENKINLNDKYTLRILAQPTGSDYKELVKRCVDETVNFINLYEVKIADERSKELFNIQAQ